MSEVKSNRMPGGIPYIIGNEAAERFSFLLLLSGYMPFLLSVLCCPTFFLVNIELSFGCR